MIKTQEIAQQPSFFVIKVNSFIRFLKVGSILHLMALAGIVLFFKGLQEFSFFLSIDSYFNAFLWLFLAIYGLTIPFFAEFDARGRYQNYKQIKDSLFEMGYDERLLMPFMKSRCQRDAVKVAAADLNYKKEVLDLFYKKGYRWYHVLPDAFIKKPWVVFHKVFWVRILFTKYYKLQNFYW